MSILSLRLGRALAAVLLACGILAAAAVGQGLYASLAHRAVPAPPVAFGRLEEGDLVGWMSAPSVGLDTPVYEGIEGATLAQGPGHVPGTPLPGRQEGLVNTVIAVERSKDGNRVARLRLGDLVQMRTPFGPRRYRVVDRVLLDPESLHFQGSDRARITLLTPYPPEEIGPAPKRLALSLEEDGLHVPGAQDAQRDTGRPIDRSLAGSPFPG